MARESAPRLGHHDGCSEFRSTHLQSLNRSYALEKDGSSPTMPTTMMFSDFGDEWRREVQAHAERSMAPLRRQLQAQVREAREAPLRQLQAQVREAREAPLRQLQADTQRIMTSLHGLADAQPAGMADRFPGPGTDAPSADQEAVVEALAAMMAKVAREFEVLSWQDQVLILGFLLALYSAVIGTLGLQ
jgi:hypothetical protein